MLQSLPEDSWKHRSQAPPQSSWPSRSGMGPTSLHSSRVPRWVWSRHHPLRTTCWDDQVILQNKVSAYLFRLHDGHHLDILEYHLNDRPASETFKRKRARSRVDWLSLSAESVLGLKKKKCSWSDSAWPFYLLLNMQFSAGRVSHTGGMVGKVLVRKLASVSSAHPPVGNTISCLFRWEQRGHLGLFFPQRPQDTPSTQAWHLGATSW